MPGSPKSLVLIESDDDLRTKFSALTTRRSVATLLDISLKQLTYHLHIKPDKARYAEFDISKKSGGIRRIVSPISALKIIQRKLNQVLRAVYEIRRPVHGFVIDKNVVTNARVHLGAKFVLNLDLKDFFPSVNFGRVRGMLMARPYNIPAEAATVLAQICCFKGELPQGAPTSPIVSNMVCATLDSHLQKIAQRYNCLYSRYADDLTFSTRANKFPKSLAREVSTATGSEIVIGGELERLIRDNGFEVNPKKTRLQTPIRRLEVTGITINNFPNVQRRYLKELRAMIHSWRAYGKAAAELYFHSRYDQKHRNPQKPKPAFERVLKGKLDYLTMVRGKGDSVCIRLLRDFAQLEPSFRFTSTVTPKTNIKLAKDAVWVLEAVSGSGSALTIKQGTGFFLAGVGLVTCAHVLSGNLQAVSPRSPFPKYPIKVLSRDDHLDLAILEMSGHHDIELEAASDAPVPQLTPIRLLGFPHYAPGHACAIKNGSVVNTLMLSARTRILIDASIIEGNSGGPVLDANNRVIGVAAKGASTVSSAGLTDKHEVIPISSLKLLRAPMSAPS